MTAPVTDAVAAVDYDHFVTEPDGSTLPQSSSISSIQQMLEALDVRPGHHVLEIGTRCRYRFGSASRVPHMVCYRYALTRIVVDS